MREARVREGKRTVSIESESTARLERVPGSEYKKNTRDDDDDEETEIRAAELKEEAYSLDDAESKEATTLVFEYLGNN